MYNFFYLLIKSSKIIYDFTYFIQTQYEKNYGKCGECGDDWSLPRPRPNENGGIYGTGLIVKK